MLGGKYIFVMWRNRPKAVKLFYKKHLPIKKKI